MNFSKINHRIPEIITALTGVIVIIGSFIFSSNSMEQNALLQSQLIEERVTNKKVSLINEKLNKFYYPIKQLLNQNKELYKLFKEGKPSGFRTLNHLIDPSVLYDGNVLVKLNHIDSLLLSRIIKTNSEISSLVNSNLGLIEDSTLIHYYHSDTLTTDVNIESNGMLAILQTHFNILELAYEGKLWGSKNRFSKHVFPRDLSHILNQRINKLLENKLKLNKRNNLL